MKYLLLLLLIFPLLGAGCADVQEENYMRKAVIEILVHCKDNQLNVAVGDMSENKVMFTCTNPK